MSSENLDDNIAKLFAEAEAARKLRHPVVKLKDMLHKGEGLPTLMQEMNTIFAVVKYGGSIVVAETIDKGVEFMSDRDFHKRLKNLVFRSRDGKHRIQLSQFWFNWDYRRQYVGRGAVFEPGGPPEIPGDMLNMFRGFAVMPAPGDWSLMKAHILKVICAGRPELFDYLVKWMAWGVQNLDKPIGVAVALLGEQGAGKGIFARTFGSLFGEHFAHVANGEQLTGRFNAGIGKSCVVFLDEALWAGDKKGEGVLKALITEPSLQLEAKFRDPIKVENRVRIIVASNNEWAVPAGVGDRRWLVLEVDNLYAGMGHPEYFNALHAEIENGGPSAMLHELLNMDLSGFNVRRVPPTAAKAKQQEFSLPSTEAWLLHILQEGAIEYRNQISLLRVTEDWQPTGISITKDDAYAAYVEFSRSRKDFRPDGKSLWSRKLQRCLESCLTATRVVVDGRRIRRFQLASLPLCRGQFSKKMGATFEWEPDHSVDAANENGASADRQAEPLSTPERTPETHSGTAAEVMRIAKDVSAAEEFFRRRS